MSRVTGLILAGGQGRRMQGQDKGLLLYRGVSLVDHVISRLQPQVDHIIISANRSYADYARRRWPVVADTFPGFAGPMAGVTTGLHCCVTDWLQVAPCDGPCLPTDLTARLLDARRANDRVLVPQALDAEGRYSSQYTFMLLHCALADSASAYLLGGGRRLRDWALQHRAQMVLFEDSKGFRNLNHREDLHG
jgi:molybdopterin-guanine dinucleotide biosynthesis protein A